MLSASYQKAIARAEKVLGWIYDHAGDNRTKNAAIVLLSLMSAFGIIAPKTATSLRDLVLSLL
jgi:uncharacterized membrane protein